MRHQAYAGSKKDPFSKLLPNLFRFLKLYREGVTSDALIFFLFFEITTYKLEFKMRHDCNALKYTGILN